MTDPHNAWLYRSWRRCASDYGIDAASGHAPARIADTLASDAIERMLLQAAAELDDLAGLANRAGYALVLANAAAVIVECRADAADGADFARIGLAPGHAWAEAQVGTNAFGTCAIEAACVSVHRSEHYSRRLATLSGAAAPLAGVDGSRLAIIGLACIRPGLSDGAHQFVRHLVARYAERIEERLFSRTPGAGASRTGGLSMRARSKVLALIDRKMGAAISVEELAAAADLSVCHFARAFKATTGLSPHRYVVRQRVARAAQLMSTTNRSLAEIALDVGFADQSHLSKHFSRVTGRSPNGYRRAGSPVALGLRM